MRKDLRHSDSRDFILTFKFLCVCEITWKVAGCKVGINNSCNNTEQATAQINILLNKHLTH